MYIYRRAVVQFFLTQIYRRASVTHALSARFFVKKKKKIMKKKNLKKQCTEVFV